MSATKTITTEEYNNLKAEIKRLKAIEIQFNELGELVKPLAAFAASFIEGGKVNKKPAPHKSSSKAEIRVSLEKKFYEKEGRR